VKSLALFAALLPASAAAPDGAVHVIELDSPAGPDSGEPDLVRGADGELYLTWIERAGAAASLRFSRLDGADWTPAREIARGEDWFVNWADVPSLAALADGTLAAHWLRKSSSETYAYEIRFALSRDSGETWSEPARLHDDPRDAEHGFVSWTATDEGFGAVWLNGAPIDPGGGHGQHGATRLAFRGVTPTGERLTETTLDERVCDCCPTSLARGADGTLWVAYRDRGEGEVRDIGVVHLSPSGWSAPSLVHADGWVIPGCPVNGPALAARGDELACAWYTGAGGGRVQVALRTGGDGGFGEPVRVDDGAAEGRAGVAWLADGALAVLWLENVSSRSEWRLRRIAGDGTAGESDALAEVASGRASGFARIAARGGGGVESPGGLVFAWTDVDGPRRVRTALVETGDD
jgi:hypothetical protein